MFLHIIAFLPRQRGRGKGHGDQILQPAHSHLFQNVLPQTSESWCQQIRSYLDTRFSINSASGTVSPRHVCREHRRQEEGPLSHGTQPPALDHPCSGLAASGFADDHSSLASSRVGLRGQSTCRLLPLIPYSQPNTQTSPRTLAALMRDSLSPVTDEALAAGNA